MRRCVSAQHRPPGQFFRKPRVAWLGCSETPDALAALQQQLGARLQTCGYRPETRPYHPHVTMARKVESSDPNHADFAPLSWRVDNFALVEVQPGRKWRTLSRRRKLAVSTEHPMNARTDFKLPPEVIQRLTRRSDAKGLVQLGAHLGLLLLAGIALLQSP